MKALKPFNQLFARWRSETCRNHFYCQPTFNVDPFLVASIDMIQVADDQDRQCSRLIHFSIHYRFMMPSTKTPTLPTLLGLTNTRIELSLNSMLVSKSAVIWKMTWIFTFSLIWFYFSLTATAAVLESIGIFKLNILRHGRLDNSVKVRWGTKSIRRYSLPIYVLRQCKSPYVVLLLYSNGDNYDDYLRVPNYNTTRHNYKMP